MQRYFVSPNFAALQSACLAASKDKGARASVWAEVVSLLTAVPTAQAEALCPIIRSVIPTSSLAYKTLTNTVSTAIRAIKCGVALHNKNGAVVGRTTIEKLCQIAEDKAWEERRP